MSIAKKVFVDGAGTIGRRLVDAISKQDDMEIVGFSKTKPDYVYEELVSRGFKLYTRSPENFINQGFEVQGTLEDALEQADVIMCCLPGKSAPGALREYKGKNVIFQGGEKHDHVDVSFVAGCNYEDAVGAKKIRVVSCNTTGLSRTLYAVEQAYGIYHVEAQLIRRGADTHDSTRGPISQIKPVIKPDGHGHHGPDVTTVIPGLSIHSMAVAVPTTLMHLHIIQAHLKDKNADEEELRKVLEDTPRVLLKDIAQGFNSTGDFFNLGNMYAYNRGTHDLYEVMVWGDSVRIEKGWAYWYQSIHQEADVVPESVDAIRAMFDMASQKDSMIRTDVSLGIRRN